MKNHSNTRSVSASRKKFCSETGIKFASRKKVKQENLVQSRNGTASANRLNALSSRQEFLRENPDFARENLAHTETKSVPLHAPKRVFSSVPADTDATRRLCHVGSTGFLRGKIKRKVYER